MKRREFLLSSSASVAASVIAVAAPPPAATVLYGDKSVPLDVVRPDPKDRDQKDLWVQASDLKMINGFELKPQGACREDVCIPVDGKLRQGAFFNLTGFAQKVHQPVVADSGVWSFGDIPFLRSAFVESRIAPDFAVPDRKGRAVHLSDFRGKKVLIVTWASW
jgi:hypothetical protein